MSFSFQRPRFKPTVFKRSALGAWVVALCSKDSRVTPPRTQRHGSQVPPDWVTKYRFAVLIIAHSLGIFAASRALRHTDIRITSQYYADKKVRITTGLDALLK